MEATGVVHDATRLAKEWHEFQQYVMGLQRLYFYVPGSHDLSNPAQEELWKAEFGRRDYDFCYKGVLMLNSGDPRARTRGTSLPSSLRSLRNHWRGNAAPAGSWCFCTSRTMCYWNCAGGCDLRAVSADGPARP